MIDININKIKIGDGVTLCGYSDRRAATVVGKTAKTLYLQEDTQTLLNGVSSGEQDALTFNQGGFSGHTEGTQRYAYSVNPNSAVRTARLTKTGWILDGKRVIEGRSGFYDFNF